MRRFATASFLLAITLSCAGRPAPLDPFEHLVRGERERAAGEALFFYLKGQSLEREGNVEGAIASYREVVALDRKSVEPLLDLARLHLDRGEAERAAPYARRAVQLDPEREEALTFLARAYMEGGKTEEAIGRFERLAASDSASGPIHYLLSMLYRARGDADLSLRSLERAVALSPDRVTYRFRLAEEYRRRGAFAEAEHEYRQAARLAPREEPVLFALGKMFVEAERWEEAAALFEELASRGYRPLDVTHRLIGVELRLGRTEEAVGHAERMTEIDPANRKLQIELADLYLRVGRVEEGLDRLRALWESDRGDVEPARRIVAYHLEKKEYQEAGALLEEILAGDPKEVWARTRLAYVYFRLNEVERSIRELETARQIEPHDPDILYLLGNSYMATGKKRQALALFQETYDLGHKPSDLLYKKGQLEDALHDREAAVATLHELIAREPRHASALNDLGYLLADMNRDLGEAEKLVLRALEIHPDSPFFRDSLGWVYYRQGRFATAIRELERALAGLDGDAEVLGHLAAAYTGAGRKGDAARIYRELLRHDPANDALREKLGALGVGDE